MAGPETNFKNKIHRQLPKEIYREGMANPYSGGTPDNYYEEKNVIWVEYKHITQLPVRVPFDIRRNNKLSKLQQKWLRRADSHGVNVAVIVGVGRTKGIILPGTSWDKEAPSSEDMLLTIKEIAIWLTNQSMRR